MAEHSGSFHLGDSFPGNAPNQSIPNSGPWAGHRKASLSWGERSLSLVDFPPPPRKPGSEKTVRLTFIADILFEYPTLVCKQFPLEVTRPRPRAAGRSPPGGRAANSPQTPHRPRGAAGAGSPAGAVEPSDFLLPC